MNTADKIGLVSGFGWLADLSFMGINPLGRFLSTLLVCLAITPLPFIFIGVVFEGRWVPLRPSQQFLSFFPGDLFLGLMTAGLLTVARSLPSNPKPSGWGPVSFYYNSSSWHLLVLTAAVVVAAALTYMEWKTGAYPIQAIMSPTKLYHNFVLYGLYGYVIIVAIFALVADHTSWWFLLALVPGVIWASLVVHDNSYTHEVAAYKASSCAHTPNWLPVWVRH